MTQGRRLGKGLGALLGDDYLSVPDQQSPEMQRLAVARIVANPFQPRREFVEEELLDLVASIRQNGLLQPLVVRPAPAGSGDGYQLVAGERRLRAITQLGWTDVPVVIRSVDDRTLLVLALVENIQREALSPLEEAEGFQHLATEFGLTQGEIAEAVGKNRSTVANTLRLLRLPPSVRRLLEEGSLTMGHARALLAVEDPGRIVDLARRTVEEGWTVRDIEARVRGETGGRKRNRSSGENPSAPTAEVVVVHALQEALQEALGTRVRLKTVSGERGTIEVPFTSPEDFERVFELLTGRTTSEVTG